MKISIVALVITCLSTLSAKSNDFTPDSLLKEFVFDVTKVIKKKKTKIIVWHKEYDAHLFLIKTRMYRAVKSEPTVRKTFKEKYFLYIIEDEERSLRDSLLFDIHQDITNLSKNHTGIPSQKNLIIDTDNNIILYAYFGSSATPQFVVWINSKLYCFEPVHALKGYGGTYSFIRSQVKVKFNNKTNCLQDYGFQKNEFIKLLEKGAFK